MAAGDECYVGEICMVGFNFAPRGFAFCNGQILAINANAALFSILGTQYGGNGTTNFGLPNLQGNAVIGQGNGPALTPRINGNTGGSATVLINSNTMASHTHGLNPVINTGTTPNTANGVGSLPAASPTTDNLYATSASATDFMAPLIVNLTSPTNAQGGGLPHNNMQPYLVTNFIIATIGVFPSRN